MIITSKVSAMKNLHYFFLLLLTGCLQVLNAQDFPSDKPASPSDDLTLTFTFNFPSCPGACDGAVYVEVDGGVPPYSYSWFNGLTGTEYLNACPGLGSITVTDALGNTEADTFYSPDPIVPVIIVNLIITQPTDGQCNGSIFLDSTGVVGHPDPSWSLDSIHFNPYYIFSNLCPGTYPLFIYVALTGCIYHQGDIILYDVTAVENLNPSFSLYPNPVTTDLQLHADLPLSVDLMDMNGKLIFKENAKRDHAIDMAAFPAGTYILKISDGEKFAFKKIVKTGD